MENRALEIITKLSEYGKTDTGTTRLSYTPEFLAAQDYLREFMLNCGMHVEIDAFGSLIGTYKGMNSDLPAVWTGSHLDTVPSGGNYDGVLGIAIPMACVSHWRSHGYIPPCDVKVIAMAEEEGTLFNMACMSSRVICGEFGDSNESTVLDLQGKSLASYLHGAGLPGKAFTMAKRDLSKIKCFLEAHIEQGEELELSNVSIGVVDSIVGIDRYEFRLRGVSNHSGTTRMGSRHDAFVAAAFVAGDIYEKATASSGEYVATIGKVNLLPNAVNVIPGEALIHIETRAANSDRLAKAGDEVYVSLDEMQHRYGVSYELVALNKIAPVQLNQKVVDLLIDTSEDMNLSYKVLPSWAGHDAKVFAEYVPTGMVFAPSVKGISHSRDEFTSKEDIDNIFKVFETTLKKLTEINL